MLAAFAANVCTKYTPNTWQLWVDDLVKNRKTVVKGATLVDKNNGRTHAYSKGSFVPEHEVITLKEIFRAKQPAVTLRLQEKTYVIKLCQPDLIVAFNGNKFVIICQSETMYLVAFTSKDYYVSVTKSLINMTQALVDKDY